MTPSPPLSVTYMDSFAYIIAIWIIYHKFSSMKCGRMDTHARTHPPTHTHTHTHTHTCTHAHAHTHMHTCTCTHTHTCTHAHTHTCVTCRSTILQYITNISFKISPLKATSFAVGSERRKKSKWKRQSLRRPLILQNCFKEISSFRHSGCVCKQRTRYNMQALVYG